MAITPTLVAAALLLAGLCPLTQAFITEDDKDELLKAHNFYRGKVSPIATNMAKLAWDDELALLAHFWSANCELMPNENRHDQSTVFDYVGQISAASANYTINLTSMVFQWYYEGLSFDYSQAACVDEDGEAQDEEEGCERYIQLVWASTTHVGCGGRFCEEIRGWDDEDGDQDENQLAMLITCFYGPGGGFAGEHPYQTGAQACSNCPNSLPLCENNLCTGSGAPDTMAKVSMVTLLLITGVLSLLF